MARSPERQQEPGGRRGRLTVLAPALSLFSKLLLSTSNVWDRLEVNKNNQPSL